jgi:hypothetical protein
MPYWDGSEWHSWVRTDKGLIKVRPVEVAVGDYVAKAPIRPSDLHLTFVEFMWQRASWDSICRYISSIIDDFHNLATSCAKIDFYFQERARIGHGVSQFVSTEIEFVVTCARSVIDLLYDATRTLWRAHVRLGDPKAEALRKAVNLKDSFSRVIYAADSSVNSAAALVDKYGLPEQIAEAYVLIGNFLAPLRKFRDSVIHHGKEIPTIFVTDQGFCVDRRAQPFVSFDVWSDSHKFGTNSLVSLRPLIAHFVFGCFDACGTLASAFERSFHFPPPLAPDHGIYLRGHHSESLLPLQELLKGGSAWWNDPGMPRTDAHLGSDAAR